tara:strand:+ start:1757 stop:2731 length:975 start_codon:yes stop_codon:yes gene_type:complete
VKQSSLYIDVLNKSLASLLALTLVLSPLACSDPPIEISSPELSGFLDDTSGPPEPRDSDQMMRLKSDVIVLPAISVTVWAIGALIVYIGTQTVFTNTIEDFEVVLDMALGNGADWDWAEANEEPLEQADHLTESLNRVAYRSETSDFYSITGNDYIRFLNMVSPIAIVDPGKLRDLMDGKVRPWGRYATDFFKALQIASIQARRLAVDDTARGLCARATVYSRTEPRVPYVAMARSRGAIDVIPALVLASVKSTIRCGMYDSNVRDFIYGYYNVNGPRGQLADIFITHMLKTVRLLHKYVDVCQMPPKLEVTLDAGDCHDVTLH